MPLLVGPGVIANVILYANDVEAKPHHWPYGGLTFVCAGVSFLVFLVLLSGQWLKRVLGGVGLSIATRILGLLVASMGVQFISSGLTNVIVHTIAPQIAKRHNLVKSIRTEHFVLLILLVSSIVARAQDSLPSWNDGAAKQAIVDFVKKTTT